MQQRQQSRYELGSLPNRFREVRDTGTTFAMFFVVPLLTAIHSKVGFSILTFGAIFGNALLFYIFNLIGNFHLAIPLAGNFGATSHSDTFRNLALLFLGVALWLRRQRWKDLKAGIRWHTFSRGVSYLEFLPFREAVIYRFIEPLCVFLAGLSLRRLGFTGLGLYVMFSAVCLRIVEAYSYEKAVERDVDTLNILLESEVQGSVAEHFSDSGAQAKARSIRETGGIATGADAGLEEQIAKRRQEAALRTAGSNAEVLS